MGRIYIGLVMMIVCGIISTGSRAQFPELVKDISPGADSSWPYSFVPVKDKLYFSARTPDHGVELWVLNAELSPPVVHMVQDQAPGPGNTNMADFVVFGERMVFWMYASDTPRGVELYYLDYNDSQQRLLKDMNPYGSSFPAFFRHQDGEPLWFNGQALVRAAIDQGSGPRLWITDGTDTGTRMIEDRDGVMGYYPQSPVIMPDGRLLFTSVSFGEQNEGLWITDGTVADSVYLEFRGHTAIGDTIVLSGRHAIFRANQFQTGAELWRSDGTQAGTVLLKDLFPGRKSGHPHNFFVWNDKVFFAADDSVHGVEPWISDGTASGTVLLKDLSPDTSGSNPRLFTACRDRVVFVTRNRVRGESLWSTDGTEAGTELLYDFHPDSVRHSIGGFTSFKDRLYFTAYTPDAGSEVWVTDGTPQGTGLFMDIGRDTAGSNPALTLIYNDRLYFTAGEGEGSQLWETTGSADSTKMVVPEGYEPGNSRALYYGALDRIAVFKGCLYYTARYNEHIGMELYRYCTDQGGNDTSSYIPSAAGGRVSAADIYPNPAENIFYIRLKEPDRDARLVVTDITGRAVYAAHLTAAETRVSTSGWSEGVYLVSLRGSRGVSVYKLRVR